MVSQFGSLEEKVWKKNMHDQPREPQPYEDCQAKSIQEIWVNFTRNGLRLGSRHQELPHTDVMLSSSSR